MRLGYSDLPYWHCRFFRFEARIMIESGLAITKAHPGRGAVFIPKTVYKKNFVVFAFALTEGEMKMIETVDLKTSSFFSHYDPAMVEWFVEMVNVRRNSQDSKSEKKNW